jgi:hypothetical protein
MNSDLRHRYRCTSLMVAGLGNAFTALAERKLICEEESVFSLAEIKKYSIKPGKNSLV